MVTRAFLFPLLAAATLTLAACDSLRRGRDCDPAPPAAATDSKVLVLQVDYLTHTFEGGTELTFPTPTPTFTVTPHYQAPGDFGNIRLTYDELSQPIFDGSIVWSGRGQRRFPSTLTPAAQFTYTPLTNIAYPGGGFENVFDPDSTAPDYHQAWQAVQALQVVRDYLASNPTASVKLFVYTPSVGIGNPADWKWMLFLKNQPALAPH